MKHCESCYHTYECPDKEYPFDHTKCTSFVSACSRCQYYEIKEKFDTFVKNQKDIPQEFIDIINKNFWDLI